MNFFFHVESKSLSSKLTIPKFQNFGIQNNENSLFSARINENKWIVEPYSDRQDDRFWFVDIDNSNPDKIFFIATEEQAREVEFKNELCDLNDFTKTSPEFRANLLIFNSVGGFSSYQSEYPFGMTQRLGTIYSDCGSVTVEQCKKVGVFFRNIYSKPIHSNGSLFLYDDSEKNIIEEFNLKLNKTSYINLTKYKNRLKHCFLITKNILGIPIYSVEYADGGLSFEHTHPPHEAIGGPERFNLVGKIKGKASEKVFKTGIS